MLSDLLNWFAENWLSILGIVLTALGTVLTAIGYWRAKRASEALNAVAALRDAFRLYETALKAQWNSHTQGRKLALSALDDLLSQCERYRKRFKDKGLKPEEWSELLELMEEARIYLGRGKTQDCHQAREFLIRCVKILSALIGSLEGELDRLVGGNHQ
ncbi:MAG: hypothetical protein NZ805_02760 [Armatimonadetes bacterium]|nr:hypothetical protein [Armatimonadota bacterium]MDW8028783.1 hypothetical protein [Armatimonadota bacterium]